MKRNNNGLENLGLIGFILSIVFLCITLVIIGKHKTECPNPEDHERVDAAIELNTAYAYLLHRVWIDEPLYVENVLRQTDEFRTLDSLKQGDHEDVFFFWSEYDSLNYRSAKETDLLVDSLLDDYVGRHLYIPDYDD